MRKAFIDTLIKLAEKDKRIFLLTGDLGFSVLEKFKEKFPGRFFNMGVAEQNMIGVAAGLALSGKIVFCYSIAPFVTMRCFEQIRNDLCFQNLNVRLVGVGGGVAYGSAGSTHHAVEDVAIMRALVNMTVIVPGDVQETKMAVAAVVKHQGPVYIRLGLRGEPVINKSNKFTIRKGFVLQDGRDITIVACGSMIATARIVSDKLTNSGFSVRLISMPTIKPIDENIIMDSIRKTTSIFTLEEHSSIGGLGSAVEEILAKTRSNVIFRKFALPDSQIKIVGSQKYLLEKVGLAPKQIVSQINKILAQGKK